MSLCRNPVRALLLCGAAVLSACSTVPSGGPSRQAVFDAGTQTNSPFLLVQLSDFVIQELAHFPGPSLYGRFGDYRAAVEQHIGVGDTVGITVFEAAAGGLFSQPVAAGATGSHSAVIPKQLVQRDGAITVPYAGRVQVAGLTPQAVEKTIVERLTGKAIEPQVIVTLSRNIASSVTVSGEVVKGARIALSARGDRLLDVIATAGALNAPAHETFVELGRDGRVVRVPFQTLMANPKENIYARPGDTLTLIHYPLTFTAVGATMQNSVIKFDAAGISLEEAIGKSAGLLDERADPEGVFVMRYEPVSVVRNYPGLTPQQAALNLVPVAYVIDMRDPKALFLARKFPMHDKDVVYVSNSPFSDLAKVLGLVNAIASPALQGASIVQTLRTNSTNSSASSLALASSLGSRTTTTGSGAGGSTITPNQ